MDNLEILEKTRKQIEIYKKNAIEHIQKEEMVPATSDLLIMRDLKTQELFIKWQINAKKD